MEERFSWGGVELQLNVNEGVIRLAKVYTDALDETLSPAVEAALTGCPCRLPELRARLEAAAPAVSGDLLDLLRAGI